jgi:hypothetical protein
MKLYRTAISVGAGSGAALKKVQGIGRRLGESSEKKLYS